MNQMKRADDESLFAEGGGFQRSNRLPSSNCFLIKINIEAYPHISHRSEMSQ